MKVFSYLFIILIFNNSLFGQKTKNSLKAISNSSCSNSLKGCEIVKHDQNMECTTSSFIVNPIVENVPCVNGNENTNYGCLNSSPNQTWMYFTVNEGNNLIFQFISSTEEDVDAAIWGPFNDLDENLCLLSESSPISCDYDAGRPDLQVSNAIVGKKYLLLLTNFDNTLMDITINQPTGGNVTYCYPKFLETKLVSCIPFDNNILDQKNVNISESGGFQFVEDQNNNLNSAIYLNGSQQIEYNGIGLLNDNYTYSLWVKPDNLPYYGQNQTLLAIGNTQALMISNNVNTAGPSIYFWGYNKSNNNSPFISFPISNTNWMHITVVRSSTKLKIYKDGALVQEGTVFDSPGYSYFKMFVGIRSFQDPFRFTGAINDLKLFKGVLSDSEIFNLYSNSSNCSYQDNFCIPVYPITGNINGTTQIFSQKGIVTLDSNVLGPSNIIYSSGGFIELNPGFGTSNNTLFKAEINGCGK